jgi:hypothetical protein
MEYGLGGTGTGLNRGIGYYSSAQIFDTYGIYGLGGASPPANTFVMEAAALSPDRTLATFYQNGVMTATNSLSGVQNIQGGISVGTLYGYGANWGGDIAEVLVYNHQLSVLMRSWLTILKVFLHQSLMLTKVSSAACRRREQSCCARAGCGRR